MLLVDGRGKEYNLRVINNEKVSVKNLKREVYYVIVHTKRENVFPLVYKYEYLPFSMIFSTVLIQ